MCFNRHIYDCDITTLILIYGGSYICLTTITYVYCIHIMFFVIIKNSYNHIRSICNDKYFDYD